MTDVLEFIFCRIGTGWHIAAIPTSICVAEFGRSGSVQRRHDHCSHHSISVAEDLNECLQMNGCAAQTTTCATTAEMVNLLLTVPFD